MSKPFLSAVIAILTAFSTYEYVLIVGYKDMTDRLLLSCEKPFPEYERQRVFYFPAKQEYQNHE